MVLSHIGKLLRCYTILQSHDNLTLLVFCSPFSFPANQGAVLLKAAQSSYTHLDSHIHRQ